MKAFNDRPDIACEYLIFREKQIQVHTSMEYEPYYSSVDEMNVMYWSCSHASCYDKNNFHYDKHKVSN